MAEKITFLLDSLPNSDNQVEVLDNLKTVLSSVHTSALGNIVPNVSFNIVFDCLNTSNSEQVELCCDVLKQLLTAFPPSLVLHHFHNEILHSLSHPEICVRKLGILQVLRVSHESTDSLLQNVDVVHQVMKTVADDSLEVANLAGKVLAALGSSSGGLSLLYSNEMMEVLRDVMAVSDIVRYRVYEVFVAISKHSLEGLQSTSQSGALQQLVNELHKDDILLQLNCLELLSDLAMSEHGLLFLDQQGIVGTIEGMMGSVESDPMAGILLPGLVKFFGCVARVHPKEVCSRNQNFVNIVFHSITSPDDPTLRSLAVQTLGFIGSTLEGKMALEKLGPMMDSGVRSVGELMRAAVTDLRIVALEAVANLLRLQVAEQTTDMLKLMEKWYSCLGSKTFDLLMSLAEQPFPEFRRVVHLVFQSLALQPWGQELMNKFPGFKEYLLNRATENTKEGKEGKFAIVQILADSPTSADIFGNPYLVKLKACSSQGPFYVRAHAEVAIEES